MLFQLKCLLSYVFVAPALLIYNFFIYPLLVKRFLKKNGRPEKSMAEYVHACRPNNPEEIDAFILDTANAVNALF